MTWNSAEVIGRCIESVKSSLCEIEHIVKDAGSNDATCRLASEANPRTIVIISSDLGIYDAMNQGYESCSGDVVAFLNSDDVYTSNTIDMVVAVFEAHPECGFVYGDIEFVDDQAHVRRVWRPGVIKEMTRAQIPHPALFIRKEVLEKIKGPFDPTYKISADLKQQLVMINQLGVRGIYIPKTLALMQLGGTSTRDIKSYLTGWSESRRAWNEVQGSGGWMFVVRKVASKISGICR